PSLALGQCLAYPQEAPALQHGKIAVDHSRGRGGSGAAEVALLQQNHPQAASGGVACNADAIQPAADDRKIVVCHWQDLEHDPEKWKPVFLATNAKRLPGEHAQTKDS